MTIEINEEDYKFLKDLQHELLTQTNDGNADPLYWGVMERREVRVPDDCGELQIYLGDGYFDTLENVVEMINKDINEELEEIWALVDKDNAEEVVDFYRDVLGNDEAYIISVEEQDRLNINTGAFLTKRACQEYIEKYGYNHTKPRTYAMTAFRNFELEHLLNVLKTIKFKEE